MKKMYYYLAVIIGSMIVSGCGGTSTAQDQENDTERVRAFYVDEPIVNLPYRCGAKEGKTDMEGGFLFVPGEICRFSLGAIELRTVDTRKLKEGDYIFENDVPTAALLQSLDMHHMYGDRIEINNAVNEALAGMGISRVPATYVERKALLKKLNERLSPSQCSVQDDAAVIAHMKQSILSYPSDKLHLTDPAANWLDQPVAAGGTLSVHDWLRETRIYTSKVPTAAKPRQWTLLAWSELGMHCMDGADYSVFSLLPPYSTLKAQLIVAGASPRIASSGVTVSYEAMEKEDGTINTGSQDKTNFWQYANTLFPILSTMPLESDKGLAGKAVQQEVPQSMEFNNSQNLFVAEGIPTVPFSDGGSYDPYPMVKVVARDKSGNVLAQTTTTLPVSDEMDCIRCHGSRMNVLEKHDKNYPDAVRNYEANLTAAGFDYNVSGLAATASNGTPVLCASCHKSNALPGSGIEGVKPLTEAIHGAHADRTDPYTQDSLKNGNTRNSCYACHPGESTKCLRGAMGSAKKDDGTSAVDCQSCHGTMEAVAQQGRKGWEDEPNCQSCHQEGKRYPKAVTDLFRGTLRSALDKRFATEQTLLDPHGPRLYKFSSGHGGIACAGCHGAQHAIYPSARPEENKQSIDLQGYAGTLRECNVCHAEGTVLSPNHGPHGLHTTDQRWVDMHGTVVLRNGTGECKSCHGKDLSGTALSRTGKARRFQLGVLDRTVSFEAGEKVSCTKCHSDKGVE